MRKRIPIIIGMLLVILSIWLLITPVPIIRAFIERIDHLGYDLQLRMRVLTHKAYPQSPVAIIDIDDRSLKIEGRWPWPRSKLATLVNELSNLGASVIAFDIFFSEKETNIAEHLSQTLRAKNIANENLRQALQQHKHIFDEDTIFANTLKQHQTILAIGFLPRAQTQNTLPAPLIKLDNILQAQLDIIRAKGYISNITILQDAVKGSGFINIFPDQDGIIRRAPLLIEYKNGLYPALALQAVLSYLSKDISLITPDYNGTKKLEGIQIGNRIIPTDARGTVLIPFIGRSYTFPYYSATDVLHSKISKKDIAGKILFIGTSATGLGDLQATSIENPFPGVEIQATLVDGILMNNFSYQPAWALGANIFVVVFIGILSAFAFPFLGPRTLGLIIILLPPALLFINNWIWDETGLILSFLIPVILVLVLAIFNILYGYLFETRRREQLKNMFGQYVPAKHIDEMLKMRSDYGLHGEDREMSVLFADIRNFTSISEGMHASELVDMLNTFFTPMTEAIFKHRGTIDKYVGDLIMAFWGAPLKDKQHARHAIEAALDMQKQTQALTEVIKSKNWPTIKIGIGINSGVMSVGDMGSRYRRNYTVLGDAVNLASRVEGLTKFYGVDIIVTESTATTQSKFIFRKLDKVRVQGKKNGVIIYEVIGHADLLDADVIQEVTQFNQAIDFYFAQHWNAAEAILLELKNKYPDKKIYPIYLDRIQDFKTNPPSSDWDGVFLHTEK